jgi:hypothetical protein
MGDRTSSKDTPKVPQVVMMTRPLAEAVGAEKVVKMANHDDQYGTGPLVPIVESMSLPDARRIANQDGMSTASVTAEVALEMRGAVGIRETRGGTENAEMRGEIRNEEMVEMAVSRGRLERREMRLKGGMWVIIEGGAV